MKTQIILFLAILTSLPFSASAANARCEGEAQIVANVTSRETDSLTYCRAKVSQSSITFYHVSGVCPLSVIRVIEQGIELGLKNGQVLWPIRVALSGLEKSPNFATLAVYLGKEEVLKRLQMALEKVS